MEKIKAAVIGCGPWGKNHIRSYTQVPDTELKLISDVSQKTLDERKKEFGCGITTDYHDILKDTEIKAVSICTPAALHYKIAKECLQAGKNILVEKPLSLTSKEGKELYELARKMGLVLMVGHVYRFDPSLIFLREQIKNGYFGKIHYIYCELAGLKPPRNDVGVIFNYAVHEIDIMSFLLDDYPSEVNVSTVHALARPGLEDYASIAATFKNSHGFCQVSWLPPGKWRDIWVIGEKKSAFVDTQKFEIHVYDAGIEKKTEGFSVFDKAKEIIAMEKKEPLKEEIIHFLNCIKKHEKPKADGEVGYKIVSVLEACLESEKAGKKIGVKYG